MRNSGAAIFFFFIVFFSVVYFPVAYCVLFFAAHFFVEARHFFTEAHHFSIFALIFRTQFCGGSSLFYGGSSFSEFLAKFPNPKFRRLVTFKIFLKFPNPILRRLVTFHHARQISEPNFPLRHRHRMRHYCLHRHPPPPHFSTFRRVAKIIFSHEPLDFFLIVRC